ncbi:recombination regulator RecX [Bacillus massiliigorillae]|uniref:recombination regulator RecX n=1 Tax=Bacillus massiliigorillae TaxID=1243664 RepID=UPI0003A69CA3|nr:recombination regulator RecX [Bacillus massiliigorillae]
MITITKIAVGVKNKNRYNIYIDQGKGEEYGFSVSEDVLIKMDLKKGMVIDDLELMEIAYQEDIQKGFSDALHYLAHRMRSEAEVVRKLKEKEYEEHIIKEVIHKLYTLKFLNDEEFAIALVNTRMNAADKGPVIIAQELKQKGISDVHAEAALQLYTNERQIQHAEKQILKLVKNKSNASTIELKRKIEQTLIRKGYSSYIIEEALRNIQISQDDEQEWNSIQIHGDKALRRYSKYTGYEFQQKMKSALYRKGFTIELIERYLEEIQQEIGE